MSSSNPVSVMDSIIGKLGELHSAPLIAKQILELTKATDYDVRQIVECLEADPALAAKILRIVNSTHYGLAHGVTSLRKAVTMMGRRSLRLIVTTFSLVEGLTKGVSGRLYNAYWRNALTMACAASRLTKHHKGLVKDNAYSAGLLVDIGMLAFAQAERLRYTKLLIEAPLSAELVQVERSAFGFDHAMLGARLLERWGFPEELIEATACHHDPIPSTNPTGLAVQAAAEITDVLWNSNSQLLATLRVFLQEQFGMTTDDFIDLAVGCRDDIQLQADLLGVRFQETFDCQALMEQAKRQQFELSLETALDLDSLAANFEDHSG